MYLLKPERTETSQNKAKPAEMTQNFKIGEIWNFLLAFVFYILCPNVQIWIFWAKKYGRSNLNEILHVPYFECVDFTFVICFWKSRTQFPKFGHFEPKSINFLILTKVCLYPISEVLISNLTFAFENFGIS